MKSLDDHTPRNHIHKKMFSLPFRLFRHSFSASRKLKRIEREKVVFRTADRKTSNRSHAIPIRRNNLILNGCQDTVELSLSDSDYDNAFRIPHPHLFCATAYLERQIRFYLYVFLFFSLHAPRFPIACPTIQHEEMKLLGRFDLLAHKFQLNEEKHKFFWKFCFFFSLDSTFLLQFK